MTIIFHRTDAFPAVPDSSPRQRASIPSATYYVVGGLLLLGAGGCGEPGPLPDTSKGRKEMASKLSSDLWCSVDDAYVPPDKAEAARELVRALLLKRGEALRLPPGRLPEYTEIALFDRDPEAKHYSIR